MFHQIEGCSSIASVTMADLKSVLRLFAASYLGADVHIRFRPSFFPFTEPSVEVDMSWHDRGAAALGRNGRSRHGRSQRAAGRRLRSGRSHRLRLRLGGRTRLCPPSRRHRHPRVLQKRHPIPRSSFRRLRLPDPHPASSADARLLELAAPIRSARHAARAVERAADDGRAESRSHRAPSATIWAIDLEVTSNRPDCLGHIGIAREVAVLLESAADAAAGRPARRPDRR